MREQSGRLPKAPGTAQEACVRPGEGARLASGVPTVDVVVPVHDESGIIDAVLEAVQAMAAGLPTWRFVFVDDASTDDTAARIDAYLRSRRPANLALLRLSQNVGKGGAVAAGIASCEADVILFTDGDLAYSLDHLPRLVQALDVADVAIGSRNVPGSGDPNVRALRRVMGRSFNWLVRTMLDLPYQDTQAGLKGFRREAAKTLFAAQRVTDFTFDVEILCRARALGMEVAEIPACVAEGHAERSSSVRLIRDPLRMFRTLVALRREGLGRRRSAARPRWQASSARTVPALGPLPQVDAGSMPVAASARE